MKYHINSFTCLALFSSLSLVAVVLCHDGLVQTTRLHQTDPASLSFATSFHQRPTQFLQHVAGNQLRTTGGGGVIMPANNQILRPAHQSSMGLHSDSTRNDQKTMLAMTDLSQEEPGSVQIVPAQFESGEGADKQILTPKKHSHQPSEPSSSMGPLDGYQPTARSAIELAMRQADTDQGGFQPSLNFMMAPEPQPNRFDWSTMTQTSTAPSPSLQLAADQAEHHKQQLRHSSNSQQQEARAQRASATTTTSTPTTTDQSNIIMGQAELSQLGSSDEQLATFEPSATSQASQAMVTSSTKLPTSTLPEGGDVGSSSSSSGKNDNTVYYEGPATPPPATDGDFYFSSSEKLPNRERASNAWWAIGTGTEFDRASNLTRDDYLDYCAKSELLVSNKQRSLCRTHPKYMQIVARGIKLAIDECQLRFASNRWNCSLIFQTDQLSSETSLESDSVKQLTASGQQVFGEVMKYPNRERSFLNAIVAAGLAHAMTKACSQGEIPEECSCDKRIKSKTNRGRIEWVACSDDIDFGSKFSREFTDNTDNDSDTASMINTHNYEVGRRVFKSATDITCTCQNGENGLCTHKKCWKHLGLFSDIGDELTKRYESATHVQPSNKDPHKLRPVRRGVRKPKRKDLVYIDESPDYCNADMRLGVLGTQNRHCNSTSSGSDSCSLLCCGRGYQMVVEEVEEDCNCKFVWCCEVKCDKCKRQVTNDLCN